MARILVIEDDACIRANIARVLQFEKHEVMVAEDGEIGVQTARTKHPDLILCDIMMPKMDGITVFETLRNELEFKEIPFVFLTARADRIEIEARLSTPVDDYLIKPFNLKDLLDVILRNLQKYRE